MGIKTVECASGDFMGLHRVSELVSGVLGHLQGVSRCFISIYAIFFESQRV